MALTMPELLIVMIISGIIFIAAMDGMHMVSGYAKAMTIRIESNNEFYNDFSRLEAIASTTDSMLTLDSSTLLYSEDQCVGSLSVMDSVLVFTAYNLMFSDTLFEKVLTLELSKEGAGIPDSVILEVMTDGNKSLRMPFALRQRPVRDIESIILNREKEYAYEEI